MVENKDSLLLALEQVAELAARGAASNSLVVGALRQAHEALSTLPIAGEGKVKALEWVPDADGDETTSSASPLSYLILGPDRHGLFELVFDDKIIKVASSEEEAKSFAQDHYQTKILSALACAPKQEVELPWSTKDLMRGLILFRTSNNAHGYTNVSILSERVYSLPQVGKDELANMMRNIADELSPSSPGKDGGQEVAEALKKLTYLYESSFDDAIPHRPEWLKQALAIVEGDAQPASTALVERLTSALQKAENVLVVYADPTGYTDGYGDQVPADAVQHEGLLAQEALDVVRAALSASTSREGER